MDTELQSVTSEAQSQWASVHNMSSSHDEPKVQEYLDDDDEDDDLKPHGGSDHEEEEDEVSPEIKIPNANGDSSPEETKEVDEEVTVP